MPISGRVLLCALLSGLPVGRAMAANIAQVKVQGGAGAGIVTLPVMPVNQSLKMTGSMGEMDTLKTLITLPGNPTVIKGVGFRADTPLPGLPQSLVTPNAQPMAVHEAAVFLESMGTQLSLEPTLEPGPGEGNAMQRQAALMSSKQEAVGQELKAFEDPQAASVESSNAMGSRLMDILTGRSNSGSGGESLSPDASGPADAFSSVMATQRYGTSYARAHSVLLPSKGSSSSSQDSSRPDEVPALGGSIASGEETLPGSASKTQTAPRRLPLIALQLSRDVLWLSYVGLPGQVQIVSLSADAAGAVTKAWLGGSVEQPKVFTPSTARAKTSSARPEVKTSGANYSSDASLELKQAAVTAAAVEGDSFSFLQQTGEHLAEKTVSEPVPVLKDWSAAAPAKSTFPSVNPFLVVSFLPILGMALLTHGVGSKA